MGFFLAALLAGRVPEMKAIAMMSSIMPMMAPGSNRRMFSQGDDGEGVEDADDPVNDRFDDAQLVLDGLDPKTGSRHTFLEVAYLGA